MEQTESDWVDWSVGDTGGDHMYNYQRQIDGRAASPDDKSESGIYEGLGGEDDYLNNLVFYEGYDSYNEDSGSSSDEGDDIQLENYSQSHVMTTPYRFMNGNDGMATCEKCGAVGIKHAFYSKSKRFCSLSCSRSFATAQREGKPLPKATEHLAQKKPPAAKKIASQGKLQTIKNTLPRTMSSKPGFVKGFDWGPYLVSCGGEGVPLKCFRHAPMSDCWDNIGAGMKVEVINYDTDLDTNTVFWIATVIKVAGYKTLMRYEGFANDPSKDFWINLCTEDVHPVGWCATVGKPLVPPKSIMNKYADWKDYLVKRLTGSRTLPSNFYNRVVESMNRFPFHNGMHVEVVDRMCVSAMRVASIDEVIGGRLRLHYEDAKDEGDEFWCHCHSAVVHPIGWSQTVGHKLHATQDYRSRCLGKIAMNKYDPDDATPSMFEKCSEPQSDSRFQVGMKLEAIDPLNLSAICVATVTKVLKNNFLMIGIDGSQAANGSDWFCYHSSSPCIFPVGFCEVNGIQLTPPRGHKGTFNWFEYLKQTKSVAAPVKLFDKDIPKHGFKPGMKLEAVDLMEPRLICVGTVNKVVGRLLRVHFDGWENEYDQWVDCESPDFYPVGWCEVMNYNLEGPRIRESPQVTPTSQPKKRKGKTQIYKGPRKSKSRKEKKPKLIGGRPMDMAPVSKDNSVTGGSTDLPLPAEGNTASPYAKSFTDFSKILPFTVKTEPGLPVGTTVDSNSTEGPPTLSPQQICSSDQVVSLGANQTNKDLVEVKTEVGITAELTSPVFEKRGGMPSVESAAQSAPTILASLQSPANVVRDNTPPLPTPTLASRSTNTNIPRLVPMDGEKDIPTANHNLPIQTENWTVNDVCHFLRINDCGQHCDSFSKKDIDGQKFLTLTKEQIVNLTGMKVGPSLKIYDLIQMLKAKIAEQKSDDKPEKTL